MKVIPCGTQAKLKLAESINGMITCINIHFLIVKYEFSYFYDGEIKSSWVHEDELVFDETVKKEIGFGK